MSAGVSGLINRRDTVGEPRSVELCVSHMPSLKAKTLRELTQEKVLLELGRRLANSIRRFSETPQNLLYNNGIIP